MPYTPAQARAIFAKEIRKHGRKKGEYRAAQIVGHGKEAKKRTAKSFRSKPV